MVSYTLFGLHGLAEGSTQQRKLPRGKEVLSGLVWSCLETMAHSNGRSRVEIPLDWTSALADPGIHPRTPPQSKARKERC